jgi:hypothetical protein
MVLRGERLDPIMQDWRNGLQCWGSKVVPPDRLVHFRNGPYYAALVWDREPSLQTRIVMTAAFPPAWNQLACIGHLGAALLGTTTTLVWNHYHPLVHFMDQEALEWVSTLDEPPDSDGSRMSRFFAPRPHRDALLQSRFKAAAWVMRCLEFDLHEVWNGLIEKAPGFLAEIWRLIFGHAAQLSPGTWQPVVGFGLHDHRNQRLGLVSITPKAWIRDASAIGLEGVLPEPGEDWTAEWRSLNTAEASTDPSTGTGRL